MLLSRRYRDRAVGLVGAFGLLVAGVFASGSVDLRPAKVETNLHATEAALDHSKTRKERDCTSALECRPEIVC
jgi:hypothetical protein